MSKNCDIMKRMKENYESRSRTYLTRRMPVILRIDGKAFHTYTRGLDKPFDEGLVEDMIETTKYLCSQIQGAKCGYTQSDEISILLTDYDKLNTDAWFDYNVQKMCSVAASMAASYFNYLRLSRYFFSDKHGEHWKDGSSNHIINAMDIIYYFPEKNPVADFDCRAFNIPKEEVANYFLARQNDAVKNSVSMVAQSMYSHNELHKKNQSDMQEMIFQKGLNWNDLHYSKKRGTFVVKNKYVNGENFPPKDNSIFFENGDYYKINSEHGKVTTHTKIEKPTIRTRWEAVETPMKFSEENFKQWL